MTVTVDPARGGRWTSLRLAGREWLWQRPDPARATVRPGDPFVDAGGLEECVPTVRGVPDHGAAWSRPWTGGRVDCGDFTLRREIHIWSGEVVARYRLDAEPGFRFIWAAHALLNLSPAAVLMAPAGTETRIDGGAVAPWPADTAPRIDGGAVGAEARISGGAVGSEARIGAGAVAVRPGGLAALGPDDGTAIGAILVDCPRVTVADGERLTFALDAPGQPASTALWRNLGGWPVGAPYRSVGVEPMLGRVWDVAGAGPGDAAVVPPNGICEWRLTLSGEIS